MRILFALTISLFLFSCEGDLNEILIEEQISQNITEGSLYKETKFNKIYFDNGSADGTEGKDFGCIGIGHTCLDAVVINLELDAQTAYDAASLAIATESVVDLKTTLLKYREIFERDIPASLIDGVLDGTLVAGFKGSLAKGNRYILFYESGSADVLFAVPYQN